MKLWISDAPGREAVGGLPDAVQVEWIPREGELPEAILQTEFLVPSFGDHRISGLLGRMGRLKVIQTLSAGVDWLVPILPRGVTLCDAAGARDVAVAEWVMAVILGSVRMLGELRDRQREHSWDFRRSGELAGCTAMILGYGSIGAGVEARLAAFEVEVIRVARRPRAGVHGVAELASLLPRAEILIVLLPLTPATAGLLDADALSLLPDGALLVNAARGQILDTAALLEQLSARRLRAALDVTDPEPPPPDDPLWDAPGLLITPHLAGDTKAADRRAYGLVGEQVRRYLRGEPLVNVVQDGY